MNALETSTAFPRIPNAISTGDLLVGGAPTQEHLQQAIAQGFTAFIDLRAHGEAGVDEARDALVRANTHYQHIPVAGAAGLTRENAQALDAALAKTKGPTVVFCASGNRVGALLALRAHWLHGASPEQALRIGREAGLTRMADVVAQMLSAT
jgi:uncharacterized protein (TIGR01244 family)